MKPLCFLSIVAILATGCNQHSTKKDVDNAKYYTSNASKKAFTKPIGHLSSEEEVLFYVGRSFFKIPWVEAPSATTARDGLGPLFSANTCRNCHPKNGAGVALKKNGAMSRSLLLRLSHKTTTNQNLLKTVGFEADSTYGAQLSSNGNQKVTKEGTPTVTYKEITGKYPDGTLYTLRSPSYAIKDLGYGALDKDTIIAPRIGSALIGLGQLELIPEKNILAIADENDTNADGISGKANYAFDPESNTTKLGRFTWKASATTVKHQTAGAAHNDMGLSNPLFPQHNCTDKQKACLKHIGKSGYAHDLPAHRLDAITYYVSNLAIPKQREPKKHTKGAKLFESLNCTACHVPSYKTASNIVIYPYSDLLLHDMGKPLADGRSEFLASGLEWRTPPLWGIGLYKTVSGEANYLHDGRARSIEEAILWHGGEAIKSKEKFMRLPKKEREKVLSFLKSI